MTLQEIAERIAETPGWFGPSDQPGSGLHWYVRVQIGADDVEIGRMELSEEGLDLIDYGVADIGSLTRRSEGAYDLVSGRFVWNASAAKIESTIRFRPDDQITSSGPPTRCLMHWLAHAMLD